MYEEDLDLARRCAAGDEQAWERFILEYRPLLYRTADALDRSGGARELADSLYADLYGIQERDGERRSLLQYFQGRSSLATWLRAVLSQRYVDQLRAGRRLESLPDDEAALHARSRSAASAADHSPNPDRSRYVARVRQALTNAVARLADRDRLRLNLYYRQQLTLAETARVLHEHESTASRQLGRARRAIREDVERQLRDEAGFTPQQIAECFDAVALDPGPLDVDEVLAAAPERKKSQPDRSAW